jgi:single-strand DNA-binding protein
MNSIQLIGRLVADPQVRDGQRTVTRFRIALDKVGNGEVDVVPVVVFDKLAAAVGNHLTKGRLVGVTGRIHTNRWTASDGTPRTSLEVIGAAVSFLDRPKRSTTTAEAASHEDVLPAMTEEEMDAAMDQERHLTAVR